MSPITLVTTIFYAVCLPIFVEVQYIYNKLWDILIDIQRKLVELAHQYLWPWVAELLQFINFESIKTLYKLEQKLYGIERAVHPQISSFASVHMTKCTETNHEKLAPRPCLLASCPR